MPLRLPHRLSLAVVIVALATSPPLLLAAPPPPEPPPHQWSAAADRASSLLTAIGRWFGLFSSDSHCTLDPSGGQLCTPGSGNRLPAPRRPAPSSGRTISRKASAGGYVSTDNHCTIDPNGGQLCSPGSGNQLPAPQ